MAENETKDHPETSASSPNSTTGAAGELKAPKDKNCPFCGQAFTSSSLGRHLDLYIKPKNPKPPDGIHDIQEIKNLRGGITRRQPRTNTKKDESRRDSSGWSSKIKSTKSDAKVTDGSPMDSPVEAKDEHMRTWFNAPTWHATGVINDLPARAASRENGTPPTGQAHRIQQMRRRASGDGIVERPEYVSDDIWKLQESAEIGRAAEMALREVLGSLEAAKRKADPPTLFEDFDFCSLSFPGLCLAMLPPPPTLFSSTPFPAAHTWSLSPPGQRQHEALNRTLNERIGQMRKGTRDNVPDSVAFKHHVHLDGAYEHWQLLTENDKSAAWNLEISRAFAREKEKREQLRHELEYAQQRNRQLEAEYDRLSRCQLPREYLLHPPKTVPVSPAVMREMTSNDQSAAQEANYDADALINRWKATVKATTRTHKPPPTQSHAYVETRRNELKGDMMLNGSVFAVNGPMPRNVDASGNVIDQPTVTYETPKHPGMIEGEDDGGMDVDADADGDEEGPGFHGNYGGTRALTRLRQNPYDMDANGVVNANGKRPLVSSMASGRSGPKLHREQPS